MLRLPERDDPLRILSLDPGSSHCGVTYLEDYLDERPKEVVNSFTAHLKDNNPVYGSLADLHGGRTIRLLSLADVVARALDEFRPHVVIVESNYLGKFAQAFAVLVECVAMIRSVVYRYDPFIPLYQVDPSSAKINIGMDRIKGTDKNDVKDAARKRTDIKWLVDFESLDEHSIDSAIIGVYCADRITPRVLPKEPLRSLKKVKVPKVKTPKGEGKKKRRRRRKR